MNDFLEKGIKYAAKNLALIAKNKLLEEQNKRYREALEEILAESYEEAGLHPDTNMQLETFIAKQHVKHWRVRNESRKISNY